GENALKEYLETYNIYADYVVEACDSKRPAAVAELKSLLAEERKDITSENPAGRFAAFASKHSISSEIQEILEILDGLEEK
ncbi:unnamed protein product, partial [Symbiodinium sp. KB8]